MPSLPPASTSDRSAPRAPRRGWLHSMAPRDPDQAHRAATPLELLFDLCFVVAVAAAAVELHHAIAEDHAVQGLAGFLAAFFAIWWAWMNFTWFASAFDPDDGLYRVVTLVQMGGVLVLAAGIPDLFDDGSSAIAVAGYVVMRLAMVAQWLRAASATGGTFRTAALRYAGGILVVQVLWVARLAAPEALLWPTFVLLVVLELGVPAFAERGRVTPWHPGHIAERYGLFTIIVLGEAILGTANALTAAFRDGAAELPGLLGLAAAGLVVVFALWWLYFDEPVEDLLDRTRVPLLWGYTHYLVFAAVAAVGAGLEVAVEVETEEFDGATVGAGLAVTLPVAVFLLAVWVLHVRHRRDHYGRVAEVGFPVAAGLVLLTTVLGAPVHLTAVVLVALVVATQLAKQRRVTV